MRFSRFGRKLTGKAGILSLMDDLGQTRTAAGDDMIMMGGGNPGQFAPFQELIRQRLQKICARADLFHDLVGAYSPPQGDMGFLRDLAQLLARKYQWPVGPENICLTNGSQTAFFMLLNLFAGEREDGQPGKICLPLTPEYIGYADLGINENFFISTRPSIELLDKQLFKYHVDFTELTIGDAVAAICLSRPTNPTGNVVTDEEMQRLDQLARQNNIPLIVDAAYGLPFPGLVYCQASPIWNDNMIVCLSLSKLGLPAVRTGIVIARPDVIEAMKALNAIISLSPVNLGAMLTREMIASGEILGFSSEQLQPFYQKKMHHALAAVHQHCADLPYRVHKPEGAFFLWLWFENLPVSSLELYRRVKERGVLIVSGHYFFPGMETPWQHKNECIRITYSQRDTDIAQGIAIIADEVRKIYEQ